MIAIVFSLRRVGTGVEIRFGSCAVHIIQPNLAFAVVDDTEFEQLTAFVAELLADHRRGVVVDCLCVAPERFVRIVVADCAPNAVLAHFHATFHAVRTVRSGNRIEVVFETDAWLSRIL